MTARLFALALAGTLILPITTVFSDDATVGLGTAQEPKLPPSAWQGSHAAVPYLDGMASLNIGMGTQMADNPFAPDLQMVGPFLLTPSIPATRLSWQGVPRSGQQPRTE